MAMSLRVLVVDDSPDDALRIERELRDGGYEVTAQRVDTPEAMARAMESQRWDLVVCDYIMPGFPGPAVLQMLRGRGIDIPFIVVSGVIGEDVAVEAMKAGAHDFVMKGSLARLLPAVERELREAALRRKHRQADEELQENRRLLQQITSASPNIFYLYDLKQQRNVYVSEQVVQILGYPPARMQESWQRLTEEIVHPEDRRRLAEHVRRLAAATGVEVMETEVRMRRIDGQWRWIRIRDVVVDRDAEGMPLRYVGTAEDVTARIEAQEQLTAFARFAEASVQGFGMAELDARITYVNPTLCRLIGEESPEDCPGKSFLDYYPEPHRQRVRDEVIPQVLAGGQWVGELALGKPGREPVPTLESFFVIPDEKGQPMYLADAVTDIRERKEAERALRESEMRYRQIFESVTDGLLICGEEARIVEVNPAACRVFGYSREELIGRLGRDLVHPDYHSACEEFRLQAHEAGAFHGEWVGVRRDGSRLDIEATATRFHFGGARHLLTVFRDVSERKAAEREVQSLHKVLAQRADQLQALASQLTLTEQRERRRLARVLHDHLQQLLYAARLKLGPLRHHVEEDFVAAVERIDELLDQSIDVSRSLTVELSPPILYEAGLVAGLEWLARQMADKHGLTVEIQAEAPPERIAEDTRVFLFNSVRELLFNVVKYAGVEHARVQMPRPRELIEVTVTDSGRGFEPEILQSPKVVSKAFGLFSIQERAELMGGRLEVDTAPGQGTRVTVAVPFRSAVSDGKPSHRAVRQ